MSPGEMLDFALGRLDEDRRAQVERALAIDPALASRMARILRRIGHLLDDGREDSPTVDSIGPPRYEPESSTP